MHTLETPRLLLRPYQDDDLQAVYAYASNPDVVRYLYWQVRTLEETRAMMEMKKQYTDLKAEGDWIVLMVVLKETNQVMGDVCLKWSSKEHAQGELGYVFAPEFHGRGYATEAARALLQFGFEYYQLHRICAKCDARNTASYNVMERLGMRREAHFVHNEIFKGEWGDELIYAMLQSEWRAREKNAKPVAIRRHRLETDD